MRTTHRTPDRGQLAFDFTPAAAVPESGRVSLFPGAEPAPRLPPALCATEQGEKREPLPVAVPFDTHLVRVLPWDFRTCFPEPIAHSFMPPLADAGKNRSSVLREIHEKATSQGLALLAQSDANAEAHRLKIHPQTGGEPANAEASAAIREQLAVEKPQAEQDFEKLIQRYAESFGKQAGEAFRSAIRVWHLGGAVITALPPIGRVLPDAVQRGNFGYEEDGVAVNPSEEEVFEITSELAEYLRELDDPDSRAKLLGQYAADFGQEAADALDRWSQCINVVEEKEIDSLQYDPGHPWHYYHLGDAAEPMPVDEIPMGPRYELPAGPKNPKKRTEFFRQMLVDQEKRLQEDRDRYTELAEKGAEALSEYDRNIAHGGDDDLAWASAMALKFSHIRYGQARIAAIRATLVLAPDGTLTKF
jgi:hypothetical protein